MLMKAALFLLASCVHSQSFDFASAGDDWGGLCSYGSFQSPIDVPVNDTNSTGLLPPLLPTHENVRFSANHSQMEMEITFPESRQRVYFESSGGQRYYELLEEASYGSKTQIFKGPQILGRERPLRNITLKSPSEHTLNGQHMAAELIFWYQSDPYVRVRDVEKPADSDDGHEVTLVSVFFDNRTATEETLENPAAQIFLTKARKQSYSTALLKEELVAQLNLRQIATYPGSLSYPPCSEEAVLRVIHTLPLPITHQQAQEFYDYYLTNSKFDSPPGFGNNRRVQKANGREILTSNVLFIREGALFQFGSLVLAAVVIGVELIS